MIRIPFARRAGAVLALASAVGLWAVAGDAAAQSCGHYVKVGGYRADHADAAAMMDHAAEQPAADDNPAPRPCSGPNCSGTPDSAPPPAPPAPDSQVRLKLGIVPPTAEAGLATLSSLIEDARLVDERDRPERIFRPPR